MFQSLRPLWRKLRGSWRDAVSLRDAVDSKATFVRLQSDPLNTDVSEYTLTGTLLTPNGYAITTPVVLTQVSQYHWSSGLQTLTTSTDSWVSTVTDDAQTEQGIWVSVEDFATTPPEDCTWTPTSGATGTPVFTRADFAKTTGQFALVDDGVNPARLWENRGDDATPNWVRMVDAGDLSPYATINSPALTGNPTAPTQVPGNNSTRIATTAFVGTALSSYATTSAVASGYQPLDSDLTAIAALTTTSTGRSLLTESLSQTGTGALVRAASPTLTGTLNAAAITASGTANVNALQIAGVDLYTALMQNYRVIDMGWATAVVTGSASSAAQAAQLHRIDNQTGTTAGSTFQRNVGIQGPSGNQSLLESISFARPLSFATMLFRSTNSTNSIARFLITASNNGAAPLNNHGFGFEIRNNRFWLVAHNGTTLTQLDTGVDWYTSTTNFMRCESDGSGTITLFRDTTQIGQITGGSVAVSGCHFSVGGTNGADASSLRFQYHRNIFLRV